jgi:hypothetical protein
VARLSLNNCCFPLAKKPGLARLFCAPGPRISKVLAQGSQEISR